MKTKHKGMQIFRITTVADAVALREHVEAHGTIEQIELVLRIIAAGRVRRPYKLWLPPMEAQATVTPIAELDPRLALPIKELGFTTRAYNALMREGVHTIGDLVAMTEADLRGIGGFGQKSIDWAKNKLTDYGLSLKGEAVVADEVAVAA